MTTRTGTPSISTATARRRETLERVARRLLEAEVLYEAEFRGLLE